MISGLISLACIMVVVLVIMEDISCRNYGDSDHDDKNDFEDY